MFFARIERSIAPTIDENVAPILLTLLCMFFIAGLTSCMALLFLSSREIYLAGLVTSSASISCLINFGLLRLGRLEVGIDFEEWIH